MAKVFISFAHEDAGVAETVRALIEYELKLSGQVFTMTDQSQIKAGDDWLMKIRDELTSADIVVLILSKRSIAKPWVNFEAGGAWLAGKRVVPVCIGNQQKGGLPPPYSHWQGVNLPDDERYLLETIAQHLKIQAPSIVDKVMKGYREPENKDISAISRFVELRRDVKFALRIWKDET